MKANLPRAVIAVPVPPETAGQLTEICVPAFVSTAEVLGTIAEAEGLLCPAPFPITAELLDAGRRLRVVANFGVGFNNVDLVEMERRGIAVCNTPGVLTGAVADLTIGMILMASRRLAENHVFASGGDWSQSKPSPALGWDLAGKVLGLVGFGRIGRAVAHRARAFGIEVIYHDTFTEAGQGFEYCRYASMDDLFGLSDVVSIHVNLTPETFHLVGEKELARMKPTAWLVNTSRGPVVDQTALVSALQRNAIGGAILDVLETEPPDRNDPILGFENAILLPHIGSATVETRAAMLDLAVRNLTAVLSGERPPECVNPGVLERALRRR